MAYERRGTQVAPLSGTYSQVLTDLEAPTIRAFRAALAVASTAPVDIVFIGDSKTEGTGASAPSTRWLQVALAKIRTALGVAGGFGYVPGVYVTPAFTQPWTLAGAAAYQSNASAALFGLGKRCIQLTAAGGTATITVGPGTPYGAVSDVDIIYSQNSTQGTFSVAVDGGSASNVNANNATQVLGKRYSVTGLNPAIQHTIVVAYVSGTICTLEGAALYNGDKTAGVRQWDASHHGVQATQYLTTDSWWSTLATIAPALVYYQLGRNDFAAGTSTATITSTIQGHIAKIRAVCTIPPSIVFGMDFQDLDATATDTYVNLRAAMRAMVFADTNVGWFDWYEVLGDIENAGENALALTAADYVHLTDKGHAVIAAAFVRLMLGTGYLPTTTVQQQFAPVATRSGLYFYTLPCTGTSTNLATSGNLFLTPMDITKTVTLTRLGAAVTTIGDVGSKVRLGIYADDGTNYPGALIVDAGQIAGDSATVQELTISVTLTPGRYWVGGVGQSITTTAPTMRAPSSTMVSIGLTAIPASTALAPNLCYAQAAVTGALPATFTQTVIPTGSAIRTFVKAA